MKQIIYFDFDGVIADSMDLGIQEVQAGLAACGYPPATLEQVLACNGPTPLQAAALLGVLPKDAERFARARGEAELLIIHNTQKIFPKIPEMLNDLKGKAELHIISNASGPYLEETLKHFNLLNAFDVIQPLIGEQSKSITLKHMLNQHKPDRAIIVGDRLGDYLAGRDNGIQSIAARYGFGSDEEYNRADIRVDTVQELWDYLKAWVRQA